MTSQLCPRCGAYWRCDCVRDEVTFTYEQLRQRGSQLTLPEDKACQHDWAEAVGVEIVAELDAAESQVYVCRLCGLYAVEQKA